MIPDFSVEQKNFNENRDGNYFSYLPFVYRHDWGFLSFPGCIWEYLALESVSFQFIFKKAFVLIFAITTYTLTRRVYTYVKWKSCKNQPALAVTYSPLRSVAHVAHLSSRRWYIRTEAVSRGGECSSIKRQVFTGGWIAHTYKNPTNGL